MSLGLALVLFVLAAAVDWLWALYTLAVGSKRAFQAAGLSMIMYALGAASTFSYVHQPLYLIPTVSGAGVGTFLALRRAK